MALSNTPRPRPGLNRPNARTTLRPQPSQPEQTAAPAASVPARTSAPPSPARRTLFKRRARPAKSESGSDLSPLFIRVGVVLVLVLLGGIGKAMSGKSSGDSTYWRAATSFDRKLERGSVKDLPSMRAQFAALPISGVSDPKLREYHNLTLEIMDDYMKLDGSEAAFERVGKKTDRLDRLIDDLNLKYAGHK